MAGAVIFDIDGTLLDSVDLHARAWQDAFAAFGHKIPFERIRYQIGKGGDQIIPLFLSNDQQEKYGEALNELRSQIFKDRYLPQVKPFPGVRELFQKIKAGGQKIAVASSAKGDELKTFEHLAGIEDLVEAETSSADAKRSKPHPDIFEAALERLQAQSSRSGVVVVGDSPHDAEAAGKAGLRTVGVLCGGFPEDDLRAAGCIAIFAGPDDLFRRYNESPLAA